MAERKAFVVRLDSGVHRAMELWARDELRSVNAQVEVALRMALRAAGRLIEPVVSDEGDAAG